MNIGRLAGLFYLGTFATGVIALAAGTGLAVANGISTICYVAVTALFYVLFRPVNPRVALVAALVSALGCAATGLAFLHIRLLPINVLAVFGVYCILVGYLILQSRTIPRAVGIAMMIGGASWLTFAAPALARALSPFNYAPGILGEGALTLFLLVKGARA